MKIFKLILLFAALSFAEGQQGFLDFSVKIGLNFGGTMPFPMPANIEKIESYAPSFIPAIEAEALHWLSKEFGVSAAIGLDSKGLKNTSKVKEYSMKFEDYNGKFTGEVNTEMSFNYLKLPILAHYAFMENFSVYAGFYYAYLLSGEFKGSINDGKLNDGTFSSPIIHEEYDFSTDLMHHDAGFSAGLNVLPYNEHILLSFDFNYGFMSVFPSDFNGIADDMRNIYGRFLLGYVF